MLDEYLRNSKFDKKKSIELLTGFTEGFPLNLEVKKCKFTGHENVENICVNIDDI